LHCELCLRVALRLRWLQLADVFDADDGASALRGLWLKCFAPSIRVMRCIVAVVAVVTSIKDGCRSKFYIQRRSVFIKRSERQYLWTSVCTMARRSPECLSTDVPSNAADKQSHHVEFDVAQAALFQSLCNLQLNKTIGRLYQFDRPSL
jgi:hypothetical protein